MTGFGFDNWYALFLPGATDKALAVRIQETVSRILLEPDTKKLLLNQGLDVVGSSQDEFAKMYVREMATWGKVVRDVGLQPN